MFIFRGCFKRLAREGGILGVVLLHSTLFASDYRQTVPETMWVITPPVDGHCAPGDTYPPECLEPTVKPSKCSCLRPVVIQVPVLALSRAEH